MAASLVEKRARLKAALMAEQTVAKMGFQLEELMAETLGDEMVGMLAHRWAVPRVALMDGQMADN